jgi:hypothetical protein
MTKNNHGFLPTGAEYLLRRQSNFKKRDEIAEKHPIICPREGLKDGIGKNSIPANRNTRKQEQTATAVCS